MGPSADTMEATVAQDKAWKHSWLPKKGDRAAILQLHKMKYHDQLCKDMGVNHRHKGWNLLAEIFAPYSAADYAGLFTTEREPCGAMYVVIMCVILFAVVFAGTGSAKAASASGVATLAVPTIVDSLLSRFKALSVLIHA